MEFGVTIIANILNDQILSLEQYFSFCDDNVAVSMTTEQTPFAEEGCVTQLKVLGKSLVNGL